MFGNGTFGKGILESGPAHIAESDVALFISGDTGMWAYLRINVHVAGCEPCRLRIEAYRESRRRLQEAAAKMPEGADWDRLAAEMTANIRVGLAAGECVAPRRGKLDSLGLKAPGSGWPAVVWSGFAWRGAAWKTAAAWGAVAAGVAMVVSAAWVLNLPSSDGDSLARSMHSLFQGTARSRAVSERANPLLEERGSIVEASSSGVELRENGVPVSIPHAASQPVAITVSAPGSASARYVDDDTGQIIVSSVYVQ